ncbi:MAG: ferritin family protein, partial [Planctomycetota bacterium]|jgi:rubrerythrin|nr:ferritin family protein [Planctomycetota bacterium]
LQAALDFESASSDRYRRLSAREPDSPFADLLNSLADEEDRHRASLAELVSGGYGQTPPFGDECPMPRKVEGEIADGEAGDMAWRREAVANLIEHERASAEFYRALADRTIVPSVKPVFQRLAEDEWRHLDRLECGFRSNGKS